MRAKRLIAGERNPVRGALYIAALPAIRFDPGMKALFERLKPGESRARSPLVGVMRRTITILNATMRKLQSNGN
ncbi:transposase (fragment) [Rhizobium mesoamericanum STM3625]|uniref:Transposase n=1 Tax=Rhizobium mesoamericanum STM3625 TaxID=1211777 RepID=K0PU48_9HYPH